jgi:raffinose/stachyose/melibiose transport system substrate-binding protein
LVPSAASLTGWRRRAAARLPSFLRPASVANERAFETEKSMITRTKPILAFVAVASLVGAYGSSLSPIAAAATTHRATAEATAAATVAASEIPTTVSGDITVLTQRTDLDQSGRLAQYAAEFNKVYPNVKVTFESITDYEGEVRIRMNTDDYGDVLVIPNSVAKDQLSTFFEPLGTVADLGQKYEFINEQAYDGTVYGIATTGNAQGIVYNKKVFEAAGITAWPTTPDEFLADLKLIKEKTDAIPLYTNYKDGWPLTQWEGNRGSISADPNFDTELAHTDAPWAPGTDHYVIDKLLYDAVNQGLTEDDPTTTAWEPSKALIGTGKVATMVLGSWAIVQMQQAAAANGGSPDDIGYMPFPHQVNGTFYSSAGGDYKNAINIHSQNKDAAKAWVFWYADKSGFAANEGGIPPLKGGQFPSQLADFQTQGVQLVEQLPAPAGEESLTNDIDQEAEIGLYDPTFPQRIVDAARGASNETLDAIFADLNAKWKAAKDKLGG